MTDTKVLPQELSELLSLANDMRLEKNDEPLVDLPKSTMRDSSNCLIANAFNYGCLVSPSGGTIGYGSPGKIYFQSEEDAKTYCKVVEIKESKIIETGPNETKWTYYAPLTPLLDQIANRFDNCAYPDYSLNDWAVD